MQTIYRHFLNGYVILQNKSYLGINLEQFKLLLKCTPLIIPKYQNT
jgi:hypothetical protein